MVSIFSISTPAPAASSLIRIRESRAAVKGIRPMEREADSLLTERGLGVRGLPELRFKG
jgi:hypothetical protein